MPVEVAGAAPTVEDQQDADVKGTAPVAAARTNQFPQAPMRSKAG
jgi:hypothetical protein